MSYTFEPNEETDVDITGLERWQVLKALHDHTYAAGMGVLHDKVMTETAAQELIADYDERKARFAHARFDYVYGRPMKISFEVHQGRSYVHRVDLYDRDAPGKAIEVIARLRKQ